MRRLSKLMSVSTLTKHANSVRNTGFLVVLNYLFWNWFALGLLFLQSFEIVPNADIPDFVPFIAFLMVGMNPIGDIVIAAFRHGAKSSSGQPALDDDRVVFQTGEPVCELTN